MAVVRYFAAAEEAAGCAVEKRGEADVAALRAALITSYPRFAALLPRCALLVDGRRADGEVELGPETIVDILPPFAGG